MDRETVIELAREAGFATSWTEAAGEALERFAALVAAHEREECAKVCDEQQEFVGGEMCCVAMNCAAAIRSRT